MEQIIMSKKELNSYPVIDRVVKGEITQKAAAEVLQITDRQVRNKLRAYRLNGPQGLVHKNKGKPSRRKWNSEDEAFSIELLKSEWHGFGPTYAAEKLGELHSINVCAETLRNSMIRSGLWIVKQNRPKHRKWRQRRPCFGMMIQLDGSPHDWFEGRGEKCTLLVFIDDATSKVVWLELVKSESTAGVIQAVRHYMQKCGRPASFYVDYGSVFSVNTNNPDREKITQFGRMLKELDVNLIFASSPQAKGRVERSNQTHQDRLVKDLRLAGISTIQEANKYIHDSYLKKHNSKFSVAPIESTNVHRSLDGYDLDNIFCLKNKRIMNNDFTITYQARLFQIEKQRVMMKPKDKIIVHEYFDGSISLWIRGTKLIFNQIKQRPVKPVVEKVVSLKVFKPAPNHPWRTPITENTMLLQRLK
jgi:hypothetical protein